MIFRAIVLAAAVAVGAGAGAGAAHAQVLDANDPAVTERPFIRQSTREPSLPKGRRRSANMAKSASRFAWTSRETLLQPTCRDHLGIKLLDEATLAWVRERLEFQTSAHGQQARGGLQLRLHVRLEPRRQERRNKGLSDLERSQARGAPLDCDAGERTYLSAESSLGSDRGSCPSVVMHHAFWPRRKLNSD